jgi:hypothetical protein
VRIGTEWEKADRAANEALAAALLGRAMMRVIDRALNVAM